MMVVYKMSKNNQYLKMSYMLDTVFPLPTIAVNWSAGWIGALPPYASDLARLRYNSCCSAIFEQLSACQMGIDSDCTEAFETCFQCYDLADEPSDDPQRTAAVELLIKSPHQAVIKLVLSWRSKWIWIFGTTQCP